MPPNCDLTLGMVCLDKREPGRTVWRMVADDRLANPTGIVQGGFLAAFADSSMGASALTFARERKVFAAKLTCTAFVLSGGGKAVFAEAEVVDDDERLVLKASSTYLLWSREA